MSGPYRSTHPGALGADPAALPPLQEGKRTRFALRNLLRRNSRDRLSAN